MGKPEESNPAEQENVHAAVSEKDCVRMGKRNNWTLKRTRRVPGPILSVLCFFRGPQTTFEDEIYDD